MIATIARDRLNTQIHLISKVGSENLGTLLIDAIQRDRLGEAVEIRV